MPLSETELRALEALAGESDNLDDLNAALQQMMDRRNTMPLADFAGLSPDQMTRFLYQPFESTELIALPELLASEPTAPILDLLLPLFEMLEAGPLKLTAKGNLPQAFVKARAATYRPEHDYSPDRTAEYAHNEDSFTDLHVARVIAELAGLLRKQHGKLHQTKKAQNLLARYGARGLYPVLLRTTLNKYNWAYADGYGEFPFIQHSWAFSCHLLQQFGAEALPATFYVERFLTAFPQTLDEIESRPYSTQEATFQNIYQLRVLKRFMGLLGLASFSWERVPRSGPRATIRATPLLKEAIQLHVS